MQCFVKSFAVSLGTGTKVESRYKEKKRFYNYIDLSLCLALENTETIKVMSLCLSFHSCFGVNLEKTKGNYGQGLILLGGRE